MKMEKEQKITDKPSNIKEETKSIKIKNIIKNVLCVCILVPLIFITLNVVWQAITKPNKIPDIFGYKIFMVLDKNMDDSINYGDLVFAKNINTDELKINDLMAFRNSGNGVTIHRINKIENNEVYNKDSNKKNIEKTFIMKALENETDDTKFVPQEKVEGLLVYKIPKLGSIIFFIQQPLVMFVIFCTILIIGLICIHIAGKLDERDRIKLELELKNKNEKISV